MVPVEITQHTSALKRKCPRTTVYGISRYDDDFLEEEPETIVKEEEDLMAQVLKVKLIIHSVYNVKRNFVDLRNLQKKIIRQICT